MSNSCLKVVRCVLAVTALVFFLSLLILRGWQKQIRNLDVSTESSRIILDRSIWGESFQCVEYISGVEVRLRDSVEKIKCHVDTYNTTWTGLMEHITNNWEEICWLPEEREEMMAFVKGELQEVDFNSGTVVMHRQKHENGCQLLLLREANGGLVMYLWNLFLQPDVLDALRAR